MTVSVSQPSRRVTLSWEGESIEAPDRITIAGLAEARGMPSAGWKAPVAAVLDGRLVSLDHVLYEGAEVRPVFSWEADGREVYRRSLTTVLQAAVRRVLPSVRLVVGQSLGGGYYHEWEGKPGPTAARVHALEKEMRRIVRADMPITILRVGERQAIKIFRERGMMDRVLLLETWWHESIRLIRLGDYVDIRHGTVVTNTGRLPFISLTPLEKGLLMRFPEPGREGISRGRPRVVKQLFGIFKETKEWNRILGVASVGELNRACITGEIEEIVRVAEGLHEQKVVHVAGALRERGGIRLALVAGPSSSGKTTFSKRLGVQLRVLGINPVFLSVDDYYVNREDTPLDRNGDPDFEAIEAVDLELFNRQLCDLLDGGEASVPRFDFSQGKRVGKEKWRSCRLGPQDILVIEGIHALNPRLTEAVAEEVKFRIYVSALTQLCIDDANRISTTDVRLLRRLVRDRLFRGHSALSTIGQWTSVKRGEARNIFPFQDRADVMFNSTLVYELAVLKIYAQRFLLEVMHGDPEFPEAYRLLKFLDLFVGISPDMVPRGSIIREFIGGSLFRY